MSFSLEALGQIVRERRERRTPRMTQQELGDKAGYKSGAGVAVSRVENGHSRPSSEHMAGLEVALNLMPGELEMLATRRTEDLLAREGARPSTSDKSLRDRLRGLQQTIERQTKQLERSVDAFNAAHDKARDEFLLPFLETAGGVSGAPEPPREDLEDAVPDEDATAEATARYRLQFASYGVAHVLSGVAGGGVVGGAAGAAAAYASFTAAVTWGTASTGAAISGLSGIAASNAALALLGGGTLAAGGAGVAGGTAMLAGLVAGPAVLLAVGGLVWAARRSRQQQHELKESLDKAESQLKDQAPGVKAFLDLVDRATVTLDYVAVHGSHAQARWCDGLDVPTEWKDLSPTQQKQFDNFVQICAAQLAVATLDPQQLLVLKGEDLNHQIGLMHQILQQSDDLVRSHV